MPRTPHRFLTAFAALGISVSATAATAEAAEDRVFPELTGRVVTGYQGWFTADGDGFGLNFNHWGVGGDFTHGKVTIDMWPDMSAHDDDEKFPTDFKYEDGSTAYVFSSTHPKTVKRHLGWMKEYGIGGAMLQRFSHALLDPEIKAFRDAVFQNVRAASRETGTPYGLMYDLSGHKAGTIVEQLRPTSPGCWRTARPTSAPTRTTCITTASRWSPSGASASARAATTRSTSASRWSTCFRTTPRSAATP